jgi:hypothetical protein
MKSTTKNVEKSRSSDIEEERELVRRIVGSPTFAKSKRLSSFLYYVCDQTLSGRSQELNEQKIGERVFGRSQDYDSSIDGIVRTHGSRLRQKLDRYFMEEGASEPIRIVIPRGGYVPVFEPRLANEPVGRPPIELPTLHAEPLPDLNPPDSRRNSMFVWALLVVVAALCIGLYLRHREHASSVAARSANPLWNQMFIGGKRTLLVPGDSGLVIWEGLMGHRLSLSEFLKGDYRRQNALSSDSVQRIADDLSNRRYTTVVDLEVLQFMSGLAQSHMGKLEMRYARDIRANDLKEEDVILVGATEANPWVELYEPVMNFTFFSDPATHVSSINNKSPQGNEPHRWDMGDGKAYAIVAYLPGLTDKGNSLIIGGTSMTGTESALDFISDDTQLLPFLRRIQRPDGRLPHFELVLEANGTSGNAVRSQIVAWRVAEN